MIELDKYQGVFQSLAIGDAYGASYEGGIVERLVWLLIGKTSYAKKRYTDDTQMSIDIAHSLIKKQSIDQNDIAQEFAFSYRWSRGYGPSAAKLLKGIRQGKPWQELHRKKFKEGSMGNGAAMRAPIIALFYPANDETLFHYVKQSAEITHAHPNAIEGAHIIAVSVCLALQNASNTVFFESLEKVCVSDIFQTKLGHCINLLQTNDHHDLKTIKQLLGNGILASESCMTAVYFALKYRDSGLESMLKKICRLGGDTDTIGAMAGSIWGAINADKEISPLAKNVENIDLIMQLAESLHTFQNSKNE